MVLLFSCSTKPGEPPSHLSRFPDDLKNNSLTVSGVYEDGWTGKTVAANLKQPSGEQVLILRGMVPKIGDADFHQEVELSVDDKVIDHRPVPLGEFQVVVPVDNREVVRHVTVVFGATQPLPGEDNRLVSARLAYIGFEPARTRIDIVHGAGIHLGSGWADVEVFNGETFRWVDNDAQVLVSSDKPGDIALSVLGEPGPGVGGPFLLKALDSSGRQVASVLLSRRETVKLFVPVYAGKANEFRLHVDSGGTKIPNDPRVLNFRVFRVDLEPFLVPVRNH
jgi:hypothetical protein